MPRKGKKGNKKGHFHVGDVEEQRLISVMARVKFFELANRGELKQGCVWTLMSLFGKATAMNVSSLATKWKRNRNLFQEKVAKAHCNKSLEEEDASFTPCCSREARSVGEALLDGSSGQAMQGCIVEHGCEARSVGEALLDGSSGQAMQGCIVEHGCEARSVGEALQEYRILEPVPDTFSIVYNEGDWSTMFSDADNCFTKGWQERLYGDFRRVNYQCPLRFVYSNVKKVGSRKSNLPLATVKAVCKHSACPCKYFFTINRLRIVCKRRGTPMHLSEEQQGRQVRGKKREQVKSLIRDSNNTTSVFEQLNAECNLKEINAGNTSSCFKPQVIATIGTEKEADT